MSTTHTNIPIPQLHKTRYVAKKWISYMYPHLKFLYNNVYVPNIGGYGEMVFWKFCMYCFYHSSGRLSSLDTAVINISPPPCGSYDIDDDELIQILRKKAKEMAVFILDLHT